jgi:hypothetical protein
VTGSCESSKNFFFNSMKGGEFLDQMSDCYLPKMDRIPCSQSVSQSVKSFNLKSMSCGM